MRPTQIAVMFLVGLLSACLLYGGKLAFDVTQQLFYNQCLVEEKIQKQTRKEVKMSKKCKEFLDEKRNNRN